MKIKKNNHFSRRSWSKAERCGMIAFALAIVLGIVDLRLAAVPLTLFLMMCALAPFLPRTGFFFPLISRGHTARPMVAITFDDGPDPATTPLLLDLLAKYRIPATFFVIGLRAAQYPQLIRQIISQGHTVGNHSFHHNRYRMFWQPALLAREIANTQMALLQLGVIPVAFRPPVGITTPAMGKVLAANRLYAVNFSCRAFDRGNRRIDRLAEKILSHVKADDIVLLHDSHPGGKDRIRQWIGEIEKILAGLPEKGLSAVPLSRLTGQPVMHRD
ncbi:MAG: polysaccharide deacetylase family protein [Deltaproteobacteria bacterium]|nr:polysaccharide deacetylase family protein [Deltaproteobacteria bacterium]